MQFPNTHEDTMRLCYQPPDEEADLPQRENQAKFDYATWFSRYPISNPTDINCKEKFDFAVEIGWKRFAAMQTARKAGHSWTKLPRRKPS